MDPREVRAAGAVVTRSGDDGPQVLLVHRPKYDDWSFPKGKLDPGEHVITAAVREVAEETGLHVRLTQALSPQGYRMAHGRTKRVDYWTARVVGDDDASRYLPNAEIDLVEWLPWGEAERRLTYPYDRVTLSEARTRRANTRALVIVRHAKALARRDWNGKDPARPLAGAGQEQAQRLLPLLTAYGITTLHTSTSTRCVQTLEPYAAASGSTLHTHRELSEEKVNGEFILELLEDLLEARAGAVLCSHRPVLPRVFDALGVSTPILDPGEIVVLHHRKGRIRSVERVQP